MEIKELDDALTFGKYVNIKIHKIIEINPAYLKFLIDKKILYLSKNANKKLKEKLNVKNKLFKRERINLVPIKDDLKSRCEYYCNVNNIILNKLDIKFLETFEGVTNPSKNFIKWWNSIKTK
jgi:hypothetical protein